MVYFKRAVVSAQTNFSGLVRSIGQVGYLFVIDIEQHSVVVNQNL